VLLNKLHNKYSKFIYFAATFCLISLASCVDQSSINTSFTTSEFKLKLLSVNFSLNYLVQNNLPWPAPPEESAIAVNQLPALSAFNLVNPVPIASVTKIMTAYVILKDHPLEPTQSGPAITINQQDAQAYYTFINQNDSSVRVIAGEQLSELQLLEALLVPSADNVADILAVWDSGSIYKFVIKMNQVAKSLGMDHTIYVDPSGLDPRNVSTPADQIILAQKAMEIPAFSAIVSLNHIVLPVAGWEPNYNPALGLSGIDGVKSGYTFQAGGCLVFSAKKLIGNNLVRITGAIFGYKGPVALTTVAQQAIRLLQAFTEQITLINSQGDAFEFKIITPYGSYLAASAPIVNLISYPGLSYVYRVRYSKSNPKVGKVFGNVDLLSSNTIVESLPIYIKSKLS
jgi:D-alanyl-D-alanine carboxypeptidase (penicillin-binding protein 5/6)